jgi:agmatinase
MPEVQSYRFADALASYDDAQYVILGVPFDNTTSYRPGARLGPRAIREVTYNFEPYVPAFDLDMDQVPLHDLGDLEVPVVPEGMVTQVEDAVAELVRDGKFPVLLRRRAHAHRRRRPRGQAGGMSLDAHLDLRSEYRGARYNHGCTNRISMRRRRRTSRSSGLRSGEREQFELPGPALHHRRRGPSGWHQRGPRRRDGRDRVPFGPLSVDADDRLLPDPGSRDARAVRPLALRRLCRGERLAPLSAGFTTSRSARLTRPDRRCCGRAWSGSCRGPLVEPRAWSVRYPY